MGYICPHCGTRLPAVGDAFCPECREPLPETPVLEDSLDAGAGATSPPVSNFVWYATEERLNSPFKMQLMDDRGSLELFPRQVRFSGGKGVIDCTNVRALLLVRQAVPWLSLLLGNLLILGWISFGGMTYFTWQNPATIPLLVGLNAFAFFGGGPVKWVRVEYLDGSGQERRAYFIDGSAIGLGKFFGGTTRLLQEMRAKVLAD